jgi:hypothetical protein
MASTLIRTDRRSERIEPANGSHWKLEELQTLVGGYIEVVRTPDGDWLVVDEEGLLKRKAPNAIASALAVRRIVGDAVYVTTLYELNGPDEE